MKYNEVTKQIAEISANTHFDFQAKGEQIQKQLDSCSKPDLQEHLRFAGIIPECFSHDSTEEKLFAKYCDALLARALRELNLNAYAIKERADAADVHATGKGYTLVGDAKAFRMSRTAKNQKDFKVESLSQWRKDANFACLVGPLNQYPNSNSQIYAQATRFNVSILSYAHLWFLIEHGVRDSTELIKLWTVAAPLKESQDAIAYWQAVNSCILKLANKAKTFWEAAMVKFTDALREQSQIQIEYWSLEKKRVFALPKDELAKELIEALKIDSKIDVIKKSTPVSPKETSVSSI